MSMRNTAILALAAAGAAAALVSRRVKRRFDLAGKTALVTGGSRGLGLLIARDLAKRGARVALCARDETELLRAVADLESRGAEAVAFPCDITDRLAVERLVSDVADRLGSVDVLVNNAGSIQVGPMELMTLDDFEHAMKVHFWGPLTATLAVLPGMRERGGGRIVNIASIGGKIAVPHLLPYSASKFALVGLSEGLRAELAKDGILVTTVCPGLMRTGSPRNALFKGQHRAEYAWFAISDALPGSSMSADRAAAQIVEACRRGDAELVLSMPAKAAAIFHGVLPGPTADIMGLVNTHLLPSPGGIGTRSVTGAESESFLAPSWLTTLNDRAAEENNETGNLN